MTVLVFLVSVPIAVEAIAALLGLIDCRRHPEIMPRKLRRAAWMIAICAGWLVLNSTDAAAVAAAFAVVVVASVSAHYLPRVASRLTRRANRPFD